MATMSGDAQQLEQVVINLVANALEALPEAGGDIAIGTGLNQNASCIEIWVSDEGVGIPREHLERIFEPFFTTKQDTGGTGLGLAITYTLVRYEPSAARCRLNPSRALAPARVSCCRACRQCAGGSAMPCWQRIDGASRRGPLRQPSRPPSSPLDISV
ncbi:MAG: sensor histidine kinase [Acidiferrobacterales bacterium]